jgi:ornithine decarboxylase
MFHSTAYISRAHTPQRRFNSRPNSSDLQFLGEPSVSGSETLAKLRLDNFEASRFVKETLSKIVQIKKNDQKDDIAQSNISNDSISSVDFVRRIGKQVLSQLGDIDTPLVMMDLNNVRTQFNRWKKCLPTVQPYYAVKCNPDAVLVAYLQSLGCDFDCATDAEMNLVVNKLGHNPERVVFSNPCKLESHIRFAKSVGVYTTIIDNHDEIIKIKRNNPKAQVLIRLVCSDSGAQAPMSLKFGATREQVRPLLEHAAEVGLEVIGVHFHVGSGCSDPLSFKTAIMDARRAFDIGCEIGHKMHILDLGGGFPGLDVTDGTCHTSNGVTFEEMSVIINSMLHQLFPNDSQSPMYKIIAEPGRFFGQGCQSMINKVMGKSVVGMTDDGTRKLIRYYMTDGLYGLLSCIVFDHQDNFTPAILEDKREPKADEPNPHGVLFGPTCDGLDKIGEIDHLPELEVGDRLIYSQVGAYTSATATSFNGFAPATVFYYDTE